MTFRGCGPARSGGGRGRKPVWLTVLHSAGTLCLFFPFLLPTALRGGRESPISQLGNSRLWESNRPRSHGGKRQSPDSDLGLMVWTTKGTRKTGWGLPPCLCWGSVRDWNVGPF